MANIKSQIKRTKQAEKARQRNIAVKSTLKTQIKKFEQAVAQKKKQQAKELLAETIKALDKAASKGIIHSNRASSKKAKMASKLNGLKQNTEKVEHSKKPKKSSQKA